MCGKRRGNPVSLVDNGLYLSIGLEKDKLSERNVSLVDIAMMELKQKNVPNKLAETAAHVITSGRL